MNIQKSIGLLLIIFAFALGYLGFKKLNEKSADIKIGEVEIVAKTSESKSQAYVYLASGAFLLIVGVILVSRKKST